MDKKKLKQVAPRFFQFLLKRQAVAAYIGAWSTRGDSTLNKSLTEPSDSNVNNIMQAFNWKAARSAGYEPIVGWHTLSVAWSRVC